MVFDDPTSLAFIISYDTDKTVSVGISVTLPCDAEPYNAYEEAIAKLGSMVTGNWW